MRMLIFAARGTFALFAATVPLTASAQDPRLGYVTFAIGPGFYLEDVQAAGLEYGGPASSSVGVGMELEVEASTGVPLGRSGRLLLGGALVGATLPMAEASGDDQYLDVVGLDLGPGLLWSPADNVVVPVSLHGLLGRSGTSGKHYSDCDDRGSTIVCEGPGTTPNADLMLGLTARLGLALVLGRPFCFVVGPQLRLLVATGNDELQVPTTHFAATIVVGAGFRPGEPLATR